MWHFTGLALADTSDFHDPLQVDILIGSDQYWLATGKTRRGLHGPTGVHTDLGYQTNLRPALWCIPYMWSASPKLNNHWMTGRSLLGLKSPLASLAKYSGLDSIHWWHWLPVNNGWSERVQTRSMSRACRERDIGLPTWVTSRLRIRDYQEFHVHPATSWLCGNNQKSSLRVWHIHWTGHQFLLIQEREVLHW